MPRIVHIIPTLDRAGAEKQLLLLARGLADQGFDVHVCALNRGGALRGALRAAGIPTTVVGKRLKTDPIALARLYRHLRRLRPDVVHTWNFAPGVYGRVAARATGVRHLVAGQYAIDRWKSTSQWLLDRRLARRTARFVTNSAGIRDFFVQHGLPSEKFSIIANGVEPAEPSDLERGALLRQLALPNNARLIGVVGPLRSHKRVKDLIWAADLLRVLHDNLRLLIFGDGPERHVLERFARLASDLEHVRFLGRRDDLWRIVPHLDVFWNGSAYEGQPNALMEAMAAGVPVVASDIPGNRELVVHHETGFLVPIAARAARARATDQILADPGLAAQLGTAARTRMRDHFTAEQNVHRHAALYQQLIG